jgi:hypothetical protein
MLQYHKQGKTLAFMKLSQELNFNQKITLPIATNDMLAKTNMK